MLLLSILMPAIGRVKKQAQAVACRANLTQWGVIFSMYTDCNNGRFLGGNHHNNHVAHWHGSFNTENAWTWPGGMRPEDWPAWIRGLKDY